MIYFLPLLPRGDGSGSGGGVVVGSGAVCDAASWFYSVNCVVRTPMRLVLSRDSTCERGVHRDAFKWGELYIPPKLCERKLSKFPSSAKESAEMQVVTTSSYMSRCSVARERRCK